MSDQDRRAELLRLRSQKPFIPFRIVTNDGSKHRIFEFCRVATNGRDVAVIGKKDRISRFKMSDIAEIVPEKNKSGK